jgi:RHS repeat-associated protein
LTSTWDVAGNRTRLTHPDGFYVDQDYLVTGELQHIRENGASSGVGVLATYAYDDLGRRTSVTRGNGTSTSYTFDNASRLTQIADDLSGTTYDQTFGFSYNPAGQIASNTRSNDNYAWNGHYNVNRSYTSNGLNQYTASGSVTPTYDSKGNLTSAGSTTYSYSSENLLTSTNGGIALAYDPLSRLYQTSGGTPGTTRFQYDGVDLVAEYNSSNTLLRRYVHGSGTDEPVVWYEGSGTTDRRFLSTDERGSVVATTNGSGTVTAVNSYDEYGIPAAGNSGRFGYTGQAWLPEMGMWYYKARIYSPTLGRFLQTDPIGYEGGINLYGYVSGDPVNATDTKGLEPDDWEDTTRFMDPYERRMYCDLPYPDERCAAIDPLAEIDGRIYHMNDAGWDSAVQKILAKLWKEVICSPSAGTSLYASPGQALVAGGRAAEKDRLSHNSDDERYYFSMPVPVLGGLLQLNTFTTAQVLFGCNEGEVTIIPAKGANGMSHSHRPNCGNGLSVADREAATELFKRNNNNYYIALVNESGIIRGWGASDSLLGTGHYLGGLCH